MPWTAGEEKGRVSRVCSQMSERVWANFVGTTPSNSFAAHRLKNKKAQIHKRVRTMGHNQRFHLSICFSEHISFLISLAQSSSQRPLLCICLSAGPWVRHGGKPVHFSHGLVRESYSIVPVFPFSSPLHFPRPSLLYVPHFSLLTAESLNVRFARIQHSPFPLSCPLRLCLCHYLCFCCAIMLGSQHYHHFPALFFPSPFFMPPSNPLSFSNDSVVLLWSGPNLRMTTPRPRLCSSILPRLCSPFPSFWNSLVPAAEMCRCEKASCPSVSIKCRSLSCSFFHFVLSCVRHSRFLSVPLLQSLPGDLTWPPSDRCSLTAHLRWGQAVTVSSATSWADVLSFVFAPHSSFQNITPYFPRVVRSSRLHSPMNEKNKSNYI